MHVQELPPAAWIFRIVSGLMGFTISGSLLHSEIKRRRSPTVHFSSRLLRLTSIICLWCGPISSLLIILTVVPGFCMMRYIGSATAFGTQFIFLALYEMSRLHYCFSNQQLHGNRGYPLRVFVALIAFGVISWISRVMLPILVDTPTAQCGYRDDLSFFWRMSERAILFDGDRWEDEWMNELFYLWGFVNTILAQMWDFSILLLYLWQIWKISKVYKSKQNGIWKNVLSILHRVVIITVFYQICVLFMIILYTILGILGDVMMSGIVKEIQTAGLTTCFILSCSFAIFMMLDHNTLAYVHFLYFLRRSQLKYLCFCCCHEMVDQQIEHLEPLQGLELQTNRRDLSTGIESTWFPDLSSHIGADSNGPRRETGGLSTKTVTVVDHDYVLMQE